jgi:hypothetical protein
VGTPSVYFYCAPTGPPDRALYQHTVVALAEGLRSLGSDVAGDVDYWRTDVDSDRHLIEHREGASEGDFDIVVLNDTWFESGRSLPATLFRPGRRYATVYLDASDGLRTHTWAPEMRQFDVILRTHFNDRFVYPENVRPWAYGLSQRILEATKDVGMPKDRDGRLLYNFRMPSPVRALARRALDPVRTVLPLDETTDALGSVPESETARLHWAQSGRRHYPAFYERLASSTACACFCGWLFSPWPRDQTRRDVVSRLIKRLPVGRRRILQWDSWRLWETLAAGSAMFHVALDHYGAILPVMPENGSHYVGIDLRDASVVATRIRDEPGWLGHVGVAGRAWALEHYGPVPTARRFLALLG